MFLKRDPLRVSANGRPSRGPLSPQRLDMGRDSDLNVAIKLRVLNRESVMKEHLERGGHRPRNISYDRYRVNVGSRRHGGWLLFQAK
jgi:hypothetical protein